jgi:hypothetical protein
LFTREALDAIESGRVTLAFRRWRRPSVKAGTRLRTAAGVVAIGAVSVVSEDGVGDEDLRRAGFSAHGELAASLTAGDGEVYRIEVSLAGPDPRIALREQALSASERAAVDARLSRLDAARGAPWTREVLALIAECPATRAAVLAGRLGRETLAFKADVRKLKELGLTESLEVGYRVSPRGASLLRDGEGS